jgi:chromate reductase
MLFMKTILAIAGSLRRGSFNRLLLDAAARCAPAQLRVVPYDELLMIPLFNEDLEQEDAEGPESVRRFRMAVAEADGLLIATPEYNWSVPGVLKNAIDWLSRGPDEILAGKPVAIVGASSGSWGTRLAQAALRQVLTSTDSIVLPAPALFVRNAASVFDDAGRLTDPAVRKQLTALLGAFVEWIEKTSPHAIHAVATEGALHV